MSDLISSALTGGLFGAALTVSGVYLPNTIISQMKLQDFHMLKVFLTASSVSALVIAFYERLIKQPLPRRPPSSIGWLGPYGGNIIGGLMVGAGMVLTGACPGTVLVQVGTGISSGRYAMLGGLLGGILYASMTRILGRAPGAHCTPSSAPSKIDHSLPAKLGISSASAALAFETMCLCLILATKMLAPSVTRSTVDPVVGGVLIGAAQLVSLVLTRAPVGVSTSYEDVGRWTWSCLNGGGSVGPVADKRPALPLTKSVCFSAGILASSYALSRMIPELATVEALPVSPLQAILGGMVMVFGARVAGGCTSGHGISGMSMLGTSSIISVASMFGGGIALGLLRS